VCCVKNSVPSKLMSAMFCASMVSAMLTVLVAPSVTTSSVINMGVSLMACAAFGR
jgi:hypothetical protein